MRDEFSGERKIATRIASAKPLIIVPLTEVNGFIVFLMVKNPGITSAKKAAKLLKFSTFIGLIAIYTGSTL